MTWRVYIIKEGGELQHKVWKYGRMKKMTIKQHQHDKEKDRLQNKIWVLGRFASSIHGQQTLILFHLGSMMQKHPNFQVKIYFD